jgi:hypothetical protein
VDAQKDFGKGIRDLRVFQDFIERLFSVNVAVRRGRRAYFDGIIEGKKSTL